MFDGHLNICIECVKNRVSSWAKTESGRLSDKKRQQTDKRKKWLNEYNKKSKTTLEGNKKYRARVKVGNALRAGTLVKTACEVCTEPKVEGHHDDYSKPLEVKWLCIYHHKKLHGVIKN